MSRTVTVGLDGSPESRAAAEWAAREAQLRGLPLKLVHVWEAVPPAMAQAPLLGAETHRHWTERIPREAAEGLRLRHPGLEIATRQLSGGSVVTCLTDEAREAELLVLGSRGMSALGGFLVGSVGLAVAAHARGPVAFVRAAEQAADEHVPDPAGIPSAATPFRPVVVGVDTGRPDAVVLGFAFEEAARRRTALRALHGWFPPYYYAYGLPADPELQQELEKEQAAALATALRPWREKYPDVEVAEDVRCGAPALQLVDAAPEASLVVVGRRTRRLPLGPHTGSVTHAVLHHAAAPVVVVPHD
ncbi:universal stress protein [Streptomyces echinoruber]|nr:universal stress protein [Streptomyces echinoruber]